MEEKIYQKLVAALGKTSLSERTIRSKAKRLAKTITKDEELTDDAISDSVDDLKDLAGNLSHEITTQLTEQLALKSKELEEKYKGKKPEDTSSKIELPEDIKKQIGELKNQIDELTKFKKDSEEKITKQMEEAKFNALRDDVKKSLKDKCVNSTVLQLAMYENKLDVAKSVEDNAKTIQDWYDKKVAEDVKNGFIPMEALQTHFVEKTEEEKIAQAKKDAEELAKMNTNV